MLDNEHGSVTIDTAEDSIRAAELTGMAPIVRPAVNKPEFISPFLARGAWGVQVPHVNTRAEAEIAVSACKYVPDGQRGLFSGGRAAEYGTGGSTPDYVKKANAETLVCLMLEEVEAIKNIGEIVQVKGIDVLFIGSGDLSASMGYPGQQAHPEVQALMEQGVKRIRPAGIVAGVSCPDALVRKFVGLGVYRAGDLRRRRRRTGLRGQGRTISTRTIWASRHRLQRPHGIKEDRHSRFLK